MTADYLLQAVNFTAKIMLKVVILTLTFSFSLAQRQSVALVVGGRNNLDEFNGYTNQVDLFGCGDETVRVQDYPYSGKRQTD